jgi:hypothetical protein
MSEEERLADRVNHYDDTCRRCMENGALDFIRRSIDLITACVLSRTLF